VGKGVKAYLTYPLMGIVQSSCKFCE